MKLSSPKNLFPIRFLFPFSAAPLFAPKFSSPASRLFTTAAERRGCPLPPSFYPEKKRRKKRENVKCHRRCRHPHATDFFVGGGEGEGEPIDARDGLRSDLGCSFCLDAFLDAVSLIRIHQQRVVHSQISENSSHFDLRCFSESHQQKLECSLPSKFAFTNQTL